MIANSKLSGNIHIEDNSIDADFSKLSNIKADTNHSLELRE